MLVERAQPKMHVLTMTACIEQWDGDCWEFVLSDTQPIEPAQGALLAGAQNPLRAQPITDVRGLPDDYTYETHLAKYVASGPDDRITSWLSYEEILGYFLPNQPGGPSQFLPTIIEIMKELEEARMVFWFQYIDGSQYTIAHLERDRGLCSVPHPANC